MDADQRDAERLRLALDATGIGTFVWYPQEDRGEPDARMLELFAQPPGGTLTLVQVLDTLVHPEDRPGYTAAINRAADPRGDGRLKEDIRVRQDDGSWRWLSITGQVTFDAEGRAVRMVGAALDITARRATDEQYRQLFDSIDRGFTTIELLFDDADRPVDYRFLSINHAFTQQTGLEGVIGRTMREIAPTHEAFWFETYGRVARTGQPEHFEHMAEALGRYFEVYAFRIGEPGEHQVGVLFADIGPRMRAERRLRERERLQTFLLALSDALRPIADPAEIQHVAARRLGEHLGVDRALYYEVQRRVERHDDSDWYVIRRSYHREGVSPLLGRFRAKDFGATLPLQLAQGRVLAVGDVQADPVLSKAERAAYQKSGTAAYIVVPLIKDGRHVASLTVHQSTPRAWREEEVTLLSEAAERTWAAVERARAEVALRSSEQRLREADTRKDNFLAVLAHELRNPLAPIRTGVELLGRPNGAQALPRLQPILHRQVDHIVRLVDDLMEVSRISRGVIELEHTRVDLRRVVLDAVEFVRSAIDAHRHVLSLDLGSRELPVVGDPVRLVQVVSNLLSNAARYSDPGSRITVQAGGDDEQAVVTVTDTGIGIAPERIAGIFGLFAQVDRADPRSRAGLGVGLALAQQLARMHGGDIEAASPGLGFGSTFTLRLPCADTAEALGGLASPDAGTAAPSLKVLVVDDNQDAAEMARMMLLSSGYEVRTAEGGEAALDVLSGWRPDAALIDLGMPGMSGLELAQRLRNDTTTQDLRLIALTGWGQSADMERTRDAGFSAHLVKPVKAETLLATLAESFSSPSATSG